jgi:hypothetical protein
VCSLPGIMFKSFKIYCFDTCVNNAWKTNVYLIYVHISTYF